MVCRGAVTQVDVGKHSPGQTQHAFLAESSVAEEQWAQLMGCAGVGRRGNFLPCSSAYFHPSVLHMETAFAVFHKGLLLQPSTPMAGSPADQRSFRL